MSSPVHPIARGWVSTGGTGARNYDEFADDAEITGVIENQPDSMLAVEMPHYAPGAPADFVAALPAAADRLADLKERAFRPVEDVVAVYRIGERFLGAFVLVDTGQIADRPDRPGRVIRNEDVFAAKVAERTALIRELRTLASPVLLIQTAGDTLHSALSELVAGLGEPDVTDTDSDGLPHQVWAVPATDAAGVLDAAGAGELVVADGNHRSLAAQQAGLGRFLAVVTTPASVTIAPYHRLLRNVDGPAFLAALRTVGTLTETDEPLHIGLYVDGRSYDLELPKPAGAGVDALDHAVFEDQVVKGVLGLDPADKAITYVGGDHPPSWLRAEVDAGRADVAVLLAPVGVDDFVAVNLARQKMPRKSTWFIPKARTGLVLAATDPRSES